MHIAITGGVGTGKSTVGQMLMEMGFPCLDADDLAHQAMAKGSEGYRAVVARFGKEILNQNGEVDRRRLAAIVFQEREKLKELEAIVHPYIALVFQKELKKKGKARFYLVPLLFEARMEVLFDQVWVVTCRPEQQRERLATSRGWSREEIEQRMATQMPLEEKEKRATLIIDNSGSLEETRRQVKEAVLKLGFSLK